MKRKKFDLYETNMLAAIAFALLIIAFVMVLTLLK